MRSILLIVMLLNVSMFPTQDEREEIHIVTLLQLL